MDANLLDSHLERISAERYARADAARRSAFSVIGTIAALALVAAAPFFEGGQAVVGEITLVESLLCFIAAITLWCINSAIYHRYGPNHRFYRRTQSLELLMMTLQFRVMLACSGSAVSVLWIDAPVSAVYWASLRPRRIRTHLALSYLAHSVPFIAFWVLGKPAHAAFAALSSVTFHIIHYVSTRAFMSSMVLEAKRDIAKKRAETARRARVRQELLARLRQEGGVRLASLIDRLASANRTEAPLPKAHVEQATEVLQEMARVVWALPPEDVPASLASLRDEIVRKCAPLVVPEGQLVVLLKSDNPDCALAKEVSEAALRASQELTANAIRHGRARRVRVELSCTPMVVRIMDDGIGVDADTFERSKGGIAHVRSRASALGGEISVDTSTTWRTIVDVRLEPNTSSV